jgi:hypothetical protein
MVVSRSETITAKIKKNFSNVTAGEFIAAITWHIPGKRLLVGASELEPFLGFGVQKLA